MSQLDALVPEAVTIPGRLVLDAVIHLLAADEYLSSNNDRMETHFGEWSREKACRLYEACFGEMYEGPDDDDPPAVLHAYADLIAQDLAAKARIEDRMTASRYPAYA